MLTQNYSILLKTENIEHQMEDKHCHVVIFAVCRFSRVERRDESGKFEVKLHDASSTRFRSERVAYNES